MSKTLNLSALVVSLFYISVAAGAGNYPVVLESQTSQIIAKLNTKAATQKIEARPLGSVVQWVALQLVGQPYVPRLLDQSTPEYLYISLSSTDCMLFVEEAVAAGDLLKQQNLNVDALTKEIKQLRYHGDVLYCSRNHYFKDWATDNISKHKVRDIAYGLTGVYFPYKAHIMSDRLRSNSSDIHAQDITCISDREQRVNSKQLGFIPLKDLNKNLKYIKAGDIIGIVRSGGKHADAVHHLGIAYVNLGKVGMIHASSEVGKVVIADSLTAYLAKFQDSQGIILLRPVN